MTGPLLIVILLLTTGASAFLAYLIVDAAITAPLRDKLLNALTKQDEYEQAFADYSERFNEALNRGDEHLPTDAPQPPTEPLAAKLITCRWCAGAWTSLATVITARLTLTVTTPLWIGIPIHPVDLLLIPGWTLATAYAVGWLSDMEARD